MGGFRELISKVEWWTKKVDDKVTQGLAGVDHSLAYRVHELERHHHNYDSWFEAAGTPSGETHVADRLGTAGGGGAFQLDAGNDTWGAWVQVLGSSDTPARAGNVKYDPHEISVANTERASVYFIQIAAGASGAAALTAGDYTDTVFESDSVGQKAAGIINTRFLRTDVGTKLWARCMCPGQNTATIDFYLGVHEYEG